MRGNIILGLTLLIVAIVLVLLYAVRVDDANHTLVYLLTAIAAYIGAREVVYGTTYNATPHQ